MAMTRRQLVHLLAAMPVVPALGGCAARDRNGNGVIDDVDRTLPISE